MTPKESAADERCHGGVSVSYEVAEALVDKLANEADEDIERELRKYLPSAGPFDPGGLDHTIIGNYAIAFSPDRMLRFYGGASLSPTSSEIYHAAGEGRIPAESPADNPTAIGGLDVKVYEQGNIYIVGADLLFQQWLAQPSSPCEYTAIPRALFGVGASAQVFHGSIWGDVDALVTGGISPDVKYEGSYVGGGAGVEVLLGVRLNPYGRATLDVSGVFRLGVGYGRVESDIKSHPALEYGNLESDIEDKDEAFMYFAPALRVTLDYDF
jgi:hypothetical protein